MNTNTETRDEASEGLRYDLITAAAGAVLTAYGLKKDGMAGKVAITAGAMLAATGVASMFRAAFGPRQSKVVREIIEVNATPQRVFEVWSQLENLPRFIPGVTEVRRIGDQVWRWIIESPSSARKEIDIQQVAGAPGRFLVWRSLSKEVPLSAELHLEPTGQGTRVMAVFSNWQEDGRAARIWKKLTGGKARSAVWSTLTRFKQFVEA